MNMSESIEISDDETEFMHQNHLPGKRLLKDDVSPIFRTKVVPDDEIEFLGEYIFLRESLPINITATNTRLNMQDDDRNAQSTSQTPLIVNQPQLRGEKHEATVVSPTVSTDRAQEDVLMNQPGCSNYGTSKSTGKKKRSLSKAQNSYLFMHAKRHKKFVSSNVFLELIRTCRKANVGKPLEHIENKANECINFFPEKMCNPQYVNNVWKIISEIELKDKFTKSFASKIGIEVRAVLEEFIRKSNTANQKLSKLYYNLKRAERIINKLGQQEVVSSDDEVENAYIQLNRYQELAARTYKRICQLEGRGFHAERSFLMEFSYCGKAPVEIQNAMRKHYNKTRQFPDFNDVIDIANKCNLEESLKLSVEKINEIAQQTFADFGQKLKFRREVDTYNALVSIIPEGANDPALYDHVLKEKLEKNSVFWKSKEKEIIDFYAAKQTKDNIIENDPLNTDEIESDEDESEISDIRKNTFSDTDEEEMLLSFDWRIPRL